MADILVRGISKQFQLKLQKMAKEKNLSVNQVLVFLIERSLAHADSEKNELTRRAEAFRRLKQIREDIRKRYGASEDSTPMIRKMRDGRHG